MNKIIQTQLNKSIIVKETDSNIIEVISTGKQGVPGKSAYQIAVLNGFEGTEKEWLSSLKGEAFTYNDFTPEQLAGLTGPRGPAGLYFTPKVDVDGNISWINNGNLSNPATMNIKGPQGEKGEQGEQGLVGPIGETGPKGEKGDAATITVGTVSTGIENSSVIITNSGTNTDAVLNFTIPQGIQGEKGEKGDTGLKGDTGDVGPRGYTFTPFVAENGDITWTNDGLLPNPVKVNIMGPQGPKGDTGSQGIQGIKGDKGDKGDVGEPFRIAKVYASISDMNADYDNEEVSIGNFVIIETGNVYHPDNSKLYVKTDSGYSFITDLSGSQGITGPQGESAIISEVNATIDNNVGTPLVTVDLGGTELNRTFTFNFKNVKGEQGKKGDAFIYENFTQEQLESLKGPKGDPGEKGLKGDNGISVTNAEINFSNGHLILTLE